MDGHASGWVLGGVVRPSTGSAGTGWAVAVLLVTSLLVAVRPPSGIEELRFRGLPEGVSPAIYGDGNYGVVWGPDPGTIYLIVRSGGNCPALATAMEWVSPGQVELTMERFDSLACTGDLASQTSLIDLGNDYGGADLTVEIVSITYPDEHHVFRLEAP